MLAVAVTLPGSALAQAAKAPPPSVTVTPVRKAAINPKFEFVGETQATADIELRARVDGFLEQRTFREGDDVAVGTLLFVIEKAPYEADVQSAEAAVAQAEAEVIRTTRDRERAEYLVKRGNVSEQRLDQAVSDEAKAKAEVKAAKAELNRALLNLSYTEVKAPVEGRVGRENYSVGNLVGPESGALTTLVKLDPIYVNFSVAEAILINYRQQQLERATTGEAESEILITLRLPNDSEYGRIGRINFVDNRVDPSTGTVAVRAVFSNPDRILVPGQFVTAILQRETVEEDGLLIPQAAVQEDQAGAFVLVVDKENTVAMRRIETGARVGINWEVRSGLAEGELVIYQGIQKVRAGGVVAPVVDAPAEPTQGQEPAQ